MSAETEFTIVGSGGEVTTAVPFRRRESWRERRERGAKEGSGVDVLASPDPVEQAQPKRKKPVAE